MLVNMVLSLSTRRLNLLQKIRRRKKPQPSIMNINRIGHKVNKILSYCSAVQISGNVAKDSLRHI